MPKFFFDTTVDQNYVRDEKGVELPNWEAAKMKAIKVLPNIAQDELPHERDRRVFITDVRDGTGRIVFSARLSFAALEVQ